MSYLLSTETTVSKYGKEQTRRTAIPPSDAAVELTDRMLGRFSHDACTDTWRTFMGTHWQEDSGGVATTREIYRLVKNGLEPKGFSPRYPEDIIKIIKAIGTLRPQNLANPKTIPFQNGILDPDTMILEPVDRLNAHDWCMPCNWDSKATCPNFMKWIKKATQGDHETAELLFAWLSAVLRGKQLQKILILQGHGGSGKGVFQRLVTAMIGNENVAVTSLHRLEENRFEAASLKGKRLCMISEAGKHGGAVDVLKQVTGGDELTFERKFGRPSQFTFEGNVLMTSNESLQTRDLTSGLERRRVIVDFNYRPTDQERLDWDVRGGERTVLHSEIPGIIRFALSIGTGEIPRLFMKPPAKVVAANIEGMRVNNSIADWMLDKTTPDKNALTQIGTLQDGLYGHGNDKQWLYPSYDEWCRQNGRKAVSVRRFGICVIDAAQQLGFDVVKCRHPQSRAASLSGIGFGDGSGWQ